MRRVGLIGFGSIAENGHLPAWMSLPGVEVTAVADVSRDRRERAREMLPGALLFDEPHHLIAHADVNVVDICTPPSSHADLMLAACEQGLQEIVCEKPFVLSEQEYMKVAAARQEAGTRVISVNNWLHSDLYGLVAASIQSGSIGDARRIELRTARPDCALGNTGWIPRWRTDIAHSGGGIILDHGWHQLYLMLGWFDSPVLSVRCHTRTLDERHWPVEDEALIDLDFAQAHGRIELRWTSTDRANDGLVEGTSGQIQIHDDRIVVDGLYGVQEHKFRGRLTKSSYHPEWFTAMIRYNLLDDSRKEADRNFAEAGALVSVIGAAYRSAREGGEPTEPALQGGLAATGRMAGGTERAHVRGGEGASAHS